MASICVSRGAQPANADELAYVVWLAGGLYWWIDVVATLSATYRGVLTVLV